MTVQQIRALVSALCRQLAEHSTRGVDEFLPPRLC